MTRVFGTFAYSDGPRASCWWDETCQLPHTPRLSDNVSVDVAIVGGGFTGLSAALHLADSGARVAVLESNSFGWGASGRNGGFCCLGGGLATDAELDKKYGRSERLAFRSAEKAAISFVERLIEAEKLDVDRHSAGETLLAHRPREMAGFHRSVADISENYGVAAKVIEMRDLASAGFGGGPFFGALHVPLGFGLNPRKLVGGLMRAATRAGAALFSGSPVLSMEKAGQCRMLSTPGGNVLADSVVIATNGYSSEDIPGGLAGRYMPAQSTVLVTRPLQNDELHAQGWTSDQMSYDTRKLLHYFRLMPDRRFLFGMRGGLLSGSRAEQAARRKTRMHFEEMFPAWADVESTHAWSGMVCLARNKLPFVGQMPADNRIWAAMCYHGNGVAMGTLAGRLVAEMVLGDQPQACPDIMQRPLSRFPFGYRRRVLMPPVYAHLSLKDRF